MTLTRINPSGMTFKLFDYPNFKTLIRFMDAKNNRTKDLVIDLPIEEMSKAWFNWQQKGQYIQDAFSKISNEQRKFLMTGITPDEWNEMFDPAPNPTLESLADQGNEK